MAAFLLSLAWLVWGICIAIVLTYERKPSRRPLQYIGMAGVFVAAISFGSGLFPQVPPAVAISGAAVGLVMAATSGGLLVARYRRDHGPPDLSSSGFAYGAGSFRFWALLVPILGSFAAGLGSFGWYFPDSETIFGVLPAVYDGTSVTLWALSTFGALGAGTAIAGFLFYKNYQRISEEGERLAFDLVLAIVILPLVMGLPVLVGLGSGPPMELSRVESQGKVYVTLSIGRGVGISSPVLARVEGCTLGLCSYQLLTSATGASQQMLLRPASLEDVESDRLVVAPDGRLIMLNESNCAFGAYDPATGTALFDADRRAAEAGVLTSDSLAADGPVSEIPPLVLIAEGDTLHPGDAESFRSGKSTCHCCESVPVVLDVNHPNEAARAIARELAD